MVRILTALLCVAAGVALGVLWFAIANTIEPFMSVDFQYYLDLFMEIGGAWGFLSWFAALLLRNRHVELIGACCICGVPAFLLLLFSGGDDLFTTLVAAGLFTLAAIPSGVVAARRKKGDKWTYGPPESHNNC